MPLVNTATEADFHIHNVPERNPKLAENIRTQKELGYGLVQLAYQDKRKDCSIAWRLIKDKKVHSIMNKPQTEIQDKKS